MNHENTNSAIYSEYADDLEFQELIELFINSIPQKRDDVTEFHKTNDMEHLQQIAHQLKGAGGGYGFPGLSEVSATLETACKNNSLDELDKRVDELLEYMFRLSK